MIPVLGAISAIFGEKGLVGSVVDILKGTGILKDPENELKVMQALSAYDVQVRNTEAQVVASINQTMQAEAKSEHWAQWLWRPVVGFTFSALIVNNYLLLPYLGATGLLTISIPPEVWSTMLVVLGVSAGTRGAEKIVDLWRKNGKHG